MESRSKLVSLVATVTLLSGIGANGCFRGGGQPEIDGGGGDGGAQRSGDLTTPHLPETNSTNSHGDGAVDLTRSDGPSPGTGDGPTTPERDGPKPADAPSLDGAVDSPRQCGPADGLCPSNCTGAQDVDCKKAAGATCGGNAECSSNACVDGVCCTQNCATCQNCSGPGGTCRSLPRGTADNSPPNACAGGSTCDGASIPRCIPPACAASERRCEGDTVQVCKADRSGFELDKACSGRTPYCFAADCTGCRAGQGSCGDGLCPANCPNETVSSCLQDCGPLPDGVVRRGGTGLITPSVIGECGAFQAVSAWTAEGVWCTTDNAAFAHSASDCRLTDYSPHPEYAGLSNCQDNEILAGVGRQPPGLYLCCRAAVAHRECQRQVSCRPGQYAANHGYARDDSTFLICCSP